MDGAPWRLPACLVMLLGQGGHQVKSRARFPIRWSPAIVLGAFTLRLVATRRFALWDRRTRLRPVEERGRGLEALRHLSQRDPEVAAALKSLNL